MYNNKQPSCKKEKEKKTRETPLTTININIYINTRIIYIYCLLLCCCCLFDFWVIAGLSVSRFFAYGFGQVFSVLFLDKIALNPRWSRARATTSASLELVFVG